MSTESEAAKRKKQEQRRKALRRRWWRRRLSILVLAVAILCALIACIVALVHHARKQREPAEEPVSVTEEVTEPESAAEEEADEIEILEDESDELFTLSEDVIQVPGDLVLVNGENLWTGSSAGNLVRVSDYKSGSYGLRDSEAQLNENILDPLNRMMDDFAEATGNEDIVIAVGYRSVAEQQSRWDSAVETYGEEGAALYYDPPGTSEHHTGLAFDLSFTSADGQTYTFDGTGDSAWIVEHSWEYGFVQRYPSDKIAVTGNSDELWHFRYVGPVHAALMHENDLCLEEYLDWLQQYTYDARLTTTQDGVTYEIWTAAEPVGDEDGTYTVSSDNRGGYIITKQCS